MAGVEEAYIYGWWAAPSSGQAGALPIGDIDLLVLGDPGKEQLYEAVHEVEPVVGYAVQVTVRPPGWLEKGTGSFHGTLRSRPLVQVVPAQDQPSKLSAASMASAAQEWLVSASSLVTSSERSTSTYWDAPLSLRLHLRCRVPRRLSTRGRLRRPRGWPTTKRPNRRAGPPNGGLSCIVGSAKGLTSGAASRTHPVQGGWPAPVLNPRSGGWRRSALVGRALRAVGTASCGGAGRSGRARDWQSGAAPGGPLSWCPRTGSVRVWSRPAWCSAVLALPSVVGPSRLLDRPGRVRCGLWHWPLRLVTKGGVSATSGDVCPFVPREAVPGGQLGSGGRSGPPKLPGRQHGDARGPAAMPGQCRCPGPKPT